MTGLAFLELGTSGGGDGSMVSANIPLIAAAIAPTTNAGRLPPPNKESQGPLVTDTSILKKKREVKGEVVNSKFIKQISN